MKPPILMDIPKSFETERLLIRSPLPGDGHELHAAVRESIDDLAPWMPWPKEHRTVDDSEASARRARVLDLMWAVRELPLLTTAIADVGLVGWVRGAGSAAREKGQDDGPRTE